jgi:HEAT repeat protein
VDRAVEQRLPVFVAALEDETSSIRYAACDALHALGAQAKPAVAALRMRLADDVEGVRVAAARAMYAAGERGAELAPAFIEGLTSRTIVLFEDMDERLVALGAAAVPALAKAMGHMEAVWLGEVCARIGKPAIPAMLRGLENPKPSSRRAALEALRAVEADGGFLLLPIAARLKDEDRTVRAAAARALVPLAKTCPDALVERALPDLLAFFDRETRWSDEEAAVLQALEAIGAPALPALRRIVEPYAADSVREVRETIRRIENAE